MIFVDEGVKIHAENYKLDILEAVVFPWASSCSGDTVNLPAGRCSSTLRQSNSAVVCRSHSELHPVARMAPILP